MANDPEDPPSDGDLPDDDPGGFDPAPGRIAAAAAQVELARRSGRSGAIALAQLRLAATMAAVGDHSGAIAEYGSLIAYLDLVSDDAEGERDRWLRMASPSAPPPTEDDFDPRRLQTLARIHLADSYLAVGNRAAAQQALLEAAPGAKGFGKGRLRRLMADVQRRLDSPLQESARTVHPSRSSLDQPASMIEQIAAADALNAAGEHARAARLALVLINEAPQDDPKLRGGARRALATALEGMNQPEDSARVLRDCLADFLAAEEGDPAIAVAVVLCWRLDALGRTDEAIEVARRTLAATTSTATPSARVQLMTDLGSLQDRAGDRAGARTTFESALRAAAGSPELEANARHGLAVVLGTGLAGDRENAVEALSLFDECRNDYDRLGFDDRATACEHEAAALLGRLASFPAALPRYERALARYEALPAEKRDTGTWPDEVADVQRNIEALRTGRTDRADLFRSGGHAMHHRVPDA